MSSRREEKERRRQERLAQESAHAEQARRRRTYSIVVGSVLAGAAVVAVIVAVAAGGGDGGGGGGKSLDVEAADPPTQNVSDLQSATRAGGCELKNPPIEGRGHLKPGDKKPKYETNPPSSGAHDPVAVSDGTYGVDPGDTNLVHSLEHGRVIIEYRRTIPRQRLAQLKGLFDEDPYHVILTPNASNMPYEVAAVAWGHIAGCKKIDDKSFDVLRAFAERYRDKGPEFVP